MTLVCTRTDANSTSTAYTYDALNRLTGKTYGGSSIGTGTATVAYYYDQTSYNGLTIVNGNGARTGMSDGSGTTAWSFDGMGRIAAIRKTINSVTNQANYTYNADGTTNTLQDFGGTTFTYSYDVSGRPTSIVDGSSNSYASSAVYDAAGQITSLNHQRTSGGAAYVRSIQYNNRLQPSVISTTLNGSTIQSLTYGYGAGGTNNGNILSIANGMDSTRSQTYTYDYMNRLASGRDASHWGETYTYDNWGSLWQTQQMSGLGGNNWSVTASTKNQLSNLSYDSAGEVIQDQYSDTFTYDAEGRILTAGSGTYVYDGNGNRVKKTVSGTTALYWPGILKLLDESNSSGSTVGKQVQFAGLLVWHEDTSGSGNFLFHDHLGSIRVTGSAAGTLADDNDYQSFGTLFHNYGASPSDNHYMFTGDESDSETGSDYAMFRNLGLTLGRFNRPDPYDGSYDATNPQSLNRYAYVLNNPLKGRDPFGLTDADDDSGEDADGPSWEDEGGGGGGEPVNIECNDGGCTASTVTVSVSANPDDPPPLDDCDLPGACGNPPNPPPSQNPTGVDGHRDSGVGGDSYSKEDICGASALLNKGAGTALDILGAIPVLGNWSEGAQEVVNGAELLGGFVSAAMAVSGGAPLDAGSSGAGLGLAGAASSLPEYTIKFFGTTLKVIPFIGNGLSALSAVNDIWGKDGMANYYNDCMAGKN